MPGMSRFMRPDRERDVVSSIGNAAAFFAIRTIKKSAENPENRAFFRVFDERLASVFHIDCGFPAQRRIVGEAAATPAVRRPLAHARPDCTRVAGVRNTSARPATIAAMPTSASGAGRLPSHIASISVVTIGTR